MISVPLFIAFAAMTALAVLVVLWPLARMRTLKSEHDADLAVYRDQLAEIDRDRDSGRLPSAEAEAARTEVARRLIAADKAQDAQDTAGERQRLLRRRMAAVMALIVVPLLGAGVYGWLGAPQIPGAPLAARLAAPPNREDVAILVRKVEEHLAANPQDGQGYAILAPIYLRMQRPQDAAKAYIQVIRLLGPTAERYAALGEAMVMAEDGVVSGQAVKAFEEAVKLDPTEERANYFLGAAAEQDGQPAKALAIWQAMEKRAAPEAPYLPMLRRAMARAQAMQAQAGAPVAGGPAMPGPSAEDVANAAQMSAQDRSAMIEGMVSRLEDRLNEEPNDLNGWLRLARAFTVMGQKDKASGALEKARTVFAGDPQALERIGLAARDLALEGNEP
ncbi:c-type cytochrome biogenesis protein CcmI [Xanthobacter sp. TB0139]|uniref:c-type cytochrome biogenesis protein CcmI n=1 Tax=Xanthobacter sp. TB0139 TaxID=3459178 RepID=UPI00403A0EE9